MILNVILNYFFQNIQFIMNSTQLQRSISPLEKSIADLRKKIASENKIEYEKSGKINMIERSINSRTSASMQQSKMRQIDRLRKEIIDCKKKITTFQSQIANMKAQLGRKRMQLNKALNYEQDQYRKEQLENQKRLAIEISEQKDKIDTLINMNYASTEEMKETLKGKEYDFFISHASEDKDSFVRELAKKLVERGCRVWYDEFELKIGDSLRKKIDYGLLKSKYGLVIISPSFVKKNWPEYELNGMVAKEMYGRKVILPIWHKITKDEVLNFSPSLLDKMALNTSIHSIEDILKQLLELLPQEYEF